MGILYETIAQLRRNDEQASRAEQMHSGDETAHHRHEQESTVARTDAGTKGQPADSRPQWLSHADVHSR
ncbi:hypothetical protein ACFQ88_20645 [Paenibacillus sp. NPDC056579]|uniref:hypothetical protein n=1 Tax=Paenibacillus sp. NPDC056579 TaxID=3345871 RepID=UPI0036787490